MPVSGKFAGTSFFSFVRFPCSSTTSPGFGSRSGTLSEWTSYFSGRTPVPRSE